MTYEITTATIEGTAGAPDTLQLDAPDGMTVVAAFGRLADATPDYDWGFVAFGNVAHTSNGEGMHRLIVDGDVVTGVVFEGRGEFESNPGPDVEVGIVCVGPDATTGVATLTSGSASVSYPAMSAGSRVFLQRESTGGTTVGSLYEVTARTNGTGFTIGAILAGTGLANTLDTSTVAWQVVES